MTRYCVIAHSDSFTIRQEGTGDILTFPIRGFNDAHAEAVSVRNALESAYNRGQEDGVFTERARYTEEQRIEADDYFGEDDDPLDGDTQKWIKRVDTQLVADALNDGCPVNTHDDIVREARSKGITEVQGITRNTVRYGYPTGAHDVSDRVTETWRANAAREGWETSL